MCIVDVGTTMPRISMLQPQGSGKSFPWWSSEAWQSPPLVLVQILTVCADDAHCSFLIPGCLWPQTAFLQRLFLPRLTKPASSFIYHNSHFLDSTVCRNSSLLNLHHRHSDLPGYYSFSIGESRHPVTEFCVIDCLSFSPHCPSQIKLLDLGRVRQLPIPSTNLALR